MPAVTSMDEARIGRQALKALAEVPGLSCGGLSPLARLAPPAGPPDRPALVAALERLQGDWEWAAPALLDPRLTVALLLGDAETQLAGQYLWPDPAGGSPGFQLSIESDDLVLRGPVTLEQAELTLKGHLALGGVAEIEPLALHPTTDELWALAALADTHQLAGLLRRASRVSGPPVGLREKDVVATWTAGVAEPHLGWSVSLFSLIAPDAIPPDFARRLPAVLRAMAASGLLVALEAERGDPLGDLYVLGDALESLCRARSSGVLQFGVVLQSMSVPGRAETLRLAGWRTPGGIVAADLSALPDGRAHVLLLGPSGFCGLVETALRGDGATSTPFEPVATYTKEALVTALRGRAAASHEAARATVLLSGRPALRLVCDGRSDGVPLEDGLVIGRDQSCGLAIADASTSRQHARIEATPEGWLLLDLGSSNGTWLNGVRLTARAPLTAGDAVRFGQARCQVEPA